MARKNLLKGFKRPKGVSFEHSDLRQDYGKYTAAPFEPGLGTTVGNTLRRVLLSSIKGYAITAVRMTSYNSAGTAHMVSSEFEPLFGIVEDTMEVINNLKQVRLKLTNDSEQAVLLYEWEGKREVTSDDFARSGQVEVLSGGQHIMTLSDDAKVEFEIQIDLGYGYVPSEVNERNIEVIGTIPLDAIYSPIKKVVYSVEPTRVGQRSDYDKLIFEIWTDGTVKPDDALAEAAKIIKDHFSVFINFDESILGLDNDSDETRAQYRSILKMNVDQLDLSVRSANCLKNANIKTIGELIRMQEDDLVKTRNFGKKSLQEIKEKLKEWNLGLGITDLNTLQNVVRAEPPKKEAEDET
ncbi:MAG: DNA-directed RNA polymerase subunit alpha [Spirochaetes bacterium]|nr:DNA-directed RNA polymerase subunit alpha [Spirochaetota bacterium]